MKRFRATTSRALTAVVFLSLCIPMADGATQEGNAGATGRERREKAASGAAVGPGKVMPQPTPFLSPETASPDQIRLAYRRYLDRLGTKSFQGFDQEIDVLCKMPAPDRATLQEILRASSNHPFSLEGQRRIKILGVHYALIGEHKGLAYDLTQYLILGGHPETRREVLEYYRKYADKATASDIFEAIWKDLDQHVEGLFVPLAAPHPGEIILNVRNTRADIVPLAIAPGSMPPTPWRGDIDLFTMLPFSRKLEKTLLDYLGRRDSNPMEFFAHEPMYQTPYSANLYDFGGRQYVLDLLALNFLIQHPCRKALQKLLPMLNVQVVTYCDNPMIYRQIESDYLAKDLLLNPGNEPNIFAARAILRLGPAVSSEVLKYLRKRIHEGHVIPEKKYPSATDPQLFDVDLCLLILGAFADPGTRAEFDQLGKDLEEVTTKDRRRGMYAGQSISRKVWEIAKEWNDKGGKPELSAGIGVDRPKGAASPVAKPSQ